MPKEFEAVYLMGHVNLGHVSIVTEHTAVETRREVLDSCLIDHIYYERLSLSRLSTDLLNIPILVTASVSKTVDFDTEPGQPPQRETLSLQEISFLDLEVVLDRRVIRSRNNSSILSLIGLESELGIGLAVAVGSRTHAHNRAVQRQQMI